LKAANNAVTADPGAREAVEKATGRDYDGSVRVRHFIEVILEDLGTDKLKKLLAGSLAGMKIAPYYGCLLVRPSGVTGFDDPENPVSMDKIINAIGGESIDWPAKVDCCGASLTLTRPGIVTMLSDGILGMAQSGGAQCIAVACPMCQINLDMRQDDIRRDTGRSYRMPVMYITQLLGLCLGIPGHELGLGRLINSPEKIVAGVAVNAKR
jgi:heterodisulfide reductase subunit B